MHSRRAPCTGPIEGQSLSPPSITSSAHTVTAQYVVTQTYILDLPRPDAPLIKGMVAELHDLSPLTSAQRTEIEDYIAHWRATLEAYMTTPARAAVGLKVSARLSALGSVDPRSIQVFELGSENGDWVPAATALSTLSPGASEAQGRQMVVNAINQSQDPLRASPPAGGAAPGKEHRACPGYMDSS